MHASRDTGELPRRRAPHRSQPAASSIRNGMRFLDLRDSRGPMPADRTCSSISRGTQSCKTFRLRTVRPPGLIDAEEQGNGAFAAVPVGESGCGGCIFRRCRTRQTYNTSRDGRAAPTSKGLSRSRPKRWCKSAGHGLSSPAGSGHMFRPPRCAAAWPVDHR
jgi:hypothetical protein